MKYINTIEKWGILSKAMREKGWSLWQLQFRWDMTEGLHAWFIKEGKKNVEVVTHCEEVQRAIIQFNDT